MVAIEVLKILKKVVNHILVSTEQTIDIILLMIATGKNTMMKMQRHIIITTNKQVKPRGLNQIVSLMEAEKNIKNLKTFAKKQFAKKQFAKNVNFSQFVYLEFY
jgi:predicted hydrolase (HD superfamily)